MRIKCARASGLVMASLGLVLVSGCVLEPNGAIAFRPLIIAPAPVVYAPAPVVYAPGPVVVADPVMVPDSYAWDGVEFVGIVGDQYMYLGPGNLWLVCDPFRLERFHGWERGHADWRAHAIRNDRYRTDRNGHVQKRRDER